MNRLERIVLSVGLLLLPLGALRGADPSEAPEFQEVYDLLRANLAGMDATALSQAAVKGLITQLGPRVSLVGDGPPPDTNAAPLANTALFDGAYGYLRIRQVGSGLDKQVAENLKKMTSTNKLKGLVLDLRFAWGSAYEAAAATADLFLPREVPLIDWGTGEKSSTEKSDAIKLPVAVLVNQNTAAAAEALAGILRHTDVALLLGTTTAGMATMSKEFTLKGGQRLRVATTPIKVGNGQVMPLTGLKPDIQIEVSLEDERAYYEDAFKVLLKPVKVAGTVAPSLNETNVLGTNRPSRRRYNEADLVRMSRDGQVPDSESTNTASRPTEPARPLINDPALARAIDLLKGLAVVQQFRSI